MSQDECCGYGSVELTIHRQTFATDNVMVTQDVFDHIDVATEHCISRTQAFCGLMHEVTKVNHHE